MFNSLMFAEALSATTSKHTKPKNVFASPNHKLVGLSKTRPLSNWNQALPNVIACVSCTCTDGITISCSSGRCKPPLKRMWHLVTIECMIVTTGCPTFPEFSGRKFGFALALNLRSRCAAFFRTLFGRKSSHRRHRRGGAAAPAPGAPAAPPSPAPAAPGDACRLRRQNPALRWVVRCWVSSKPTNQQSPLSL